MRERVIGRHSMSHDDRLSEVIRVGAGADADERKTGVAHGFVAHLLSIPCVGEDEDFARDASPSREVALRP